MSILKSRKIPNNKIFNFGFAILITLLFLSNCIVLNTPSVSSIKGGPDTYGYRWIDSNTTTTPYILYNWVDGVSGGTDLSLGNDQTSSYIDIGFKFPFYGNSYSRIAICSNGWATFTDAGYTSATGNTMPSGSRPNALIAPFWTDLNPGQHGNVTYNVQNMSSPKHFIITWNSVPTNLGVYQYNQTFEAVLYENGSVLFQYDSINLTQSLTPIVGIENDIGNHGLNYPTSSLENGTAVWFYYMYQAHDLSVKSLKMKAYASVNKNVEIKSNIQNFGYNDEENINVSLLVNGISVNWTGPSINLNSFEATEVIFNWQPATQGNHTVGIQIEKVPGENKTDNNLMTKTIDVRKWRGIVLYDRTHGGWMDDYNTWFNDLNLKNIAVEELTSGEITSSALKDYSVLMLSYAYQTFSSSELTAVHNFINSGHGMLILGRYYEYVYNPLSTPFEITWYDHNSGTTGNTNDLVSHEITTNVQNAYLYSIRAKLEVSGGAKGIVYDTTKDREIMLAISNESGPGRIACYADPYGFDDWRISNANNRLLATQIMEWVIGDREPPARPKGFKASNGKVGNQINLTWTANTENDLKGYYLYRATSSGNYTSEPILIPSDKSHYNDKGVHIEDNSQYFYRLAAIDEVPNISKFTAESSAKATDIIAPLVPHNFTITDLGTGSNLLISWNKNPEADVQEYRLYRADNFNFDDQEILQFSPDETSYTDIELDEGSNYYYKLSAIDEVPNESPKTPIKVGTPYDRVPPNTPKGFNATDPGLGNTALITWYPEEGEENDLKDYLIERKDRKGAINKIIVPLDVHFNSETGLYEYYDGKDLVDGKKYSYRLYARDDSKLSPPNLSPPTKWINVTPTDKTPPKTPENFSIIDESYYITNEPIHCLNISWNISEDEDLRGFIIYRFNFADFKISERKILVKLGITNYYKDYDLDEDSEYYYKITSYDEIPNESPASIEIKGVPNDVTPPPVPTNFEVVALQEGSAVKLTWNLMPDTETEGFRLYYKSQANQTEEFRFLSEFTNKENEFIHSDLVNDQEYYYKLQTFDLIPNFSPFSPVISATPSDILPPDKPTGVRIELIETGGALKISWNQNDEEDLEGYRIYRGVGDGKTYSLIYAVDINTSSILDTGLTNNKPYRYYVTAIDEVPNESERSIVKNGIPKDSIAPKTPTGLTLTVPDSTDRISVSWIHSNDSDVDSYQIYRSTDNIKFKMIAEVSFTENTYLDFDVKAGTMYYYKITASDAESNSSPKTQTVDIEMRDKDTGQFLNTSMSIIIIIVIVSIFILIFFAVLFRRRKRSGKDIETEVKEDLAKSKTETTKDYEKTKPSPPDYGQGKAVGTATITAPGISSISPGTSPVSSVPGQSTTLGSSTGVTQEPLSNQIPTTDTDTPSLSTSISKPPQLGPSPTVQSTIQPQSKEPMDKPIQLETDEKMAATIGTEPEQQLIPPKEPETGSVSGSGLKPKPDITVLPSDEATKPLPVILIPVDEEGNIDGQGVKKDKNGKITILNPKIMYSPRIPLRKPPVGKIIKR